jgi:exonuclease VII small subunit
VALPAERALNRYVEADNIWKNCEDELNCAEEQIMPKLRSKWRQATTHLDEAGSGLAALRR